MEDFPIYDTLSIDWDLLKNFKDTIDKCKFKFEIRLREYTFEKEIQHIEYTLNNKKCEIHGCKNLACILVEKNDNWIPICDILNHNVSQYSFKLIDSVKYKIIQIIRCIRRDIIKCLLIKKIYDFWW